MTIRTEITQNCDGCGDTRTLSDADNGENGGWVEVKHNQHLCPLCITMALKKEK